MSRIYYKDKDNQLSSFNDKQGYKDMCKKHPHLIGLTNISYDEAYAIANPPLTKTELIALIQEKYDQEIQKTCTAHLFNDINSARNLAMLDTSPLQAIAKEITDWELKQQSIFIQLSSDASNNIININNTSTFDDNFIHFKQQE